MDPTVVAAWIAAGVSALTLVGTVLAQFIGYRSNRKNNEQQIEATHEDTAAQIAAADKTTADTLDQQRKQFDQTLAEQRKQLDLTLTEQSKQLDRTLNEQRTRTWNERFATAADQLGSDKPAVRLAGVYAMAGLADDWEENRQTCVDVLCSYLQLPYEPDPGPDAPESQRLAFQASRKVRHTVIRVISAHLQEQRTVSWQGLDLDFTGVDFDWANFRSARFSCGKVDFRDARFSGGKVDFRDARFSGSTVDFTDAEFSGSTVRFNFAKFSGSTVNFQNARFSGGKVDFGNADFSGGVVHFNDARFSGGKVYFGFARFSGGRVYFGFAQFSAGEVSFRDGYFRDGMVYFGSAQFSGGTVDFSGARNWSAPPAFPWTAWHGAPPPGVKLPKQEDQPKP
jgi:uncharacterized protein YjbI with pentapeptide repeats